MLRSHGCVVMAAVPGLKLANIDKRMVQTSYCFFIFCYFIYNPNCLYFHCLVLPLSVEVLKLPPANCLFKVRCEQLELFRMNP